MFLEIEGSIEEAIVIRLPNEEPLSVAPRHSHQANGTLMDHDYSLEIISVLSLLFIGRFLRRPRCRGVRSFDSLPAYQ